MTSQQSVTAERYYSGMTYSEFVSRMDKNREVIEQNYRTFEPRPEVVGQLRAPLGEVRVLALAEGWCGDVARYLPAVARLCEAAGWELRVLYRDENPDLAGIWLKDGEYRAIPVFVLLGPDWAEITHFIEKPTEVYRQEEAARRRFAEVHDTLPDATLPSSQMSEGTLALYAPSIRAFRAEQNSAWQHLLLDQLAEQVGQVVLQQQC